MNVISIFVLSSGQITDKWSLILIVHGENGCNYTGLIAENLITVKPKNVEQF